MIDTINYDCGPNDTPTLESQFSIGIVRSTGLAMLKPLANAAAT